MDPLEVDDPEALGGYRLLARLGAGGMGRVYLARSAGGRTVALKVVRPELAEDGDFRRRFRREVEAARAVGGGFTAPVVDADTDAGVPWLATSYVLGPSLERAVVEHGALPEQGVWALAAGLVEALQAVHAAGLVHRDLKPANVMLAGDGPRVIDFGIARAVDGDRVTRTGLVVGSPGFMSPEQAESASVGSAGDVFSLGAVLAYAATGSGPFGDGSYAGLLYQVVHGEPDLSQVPDSFRPMLSACLAKSPSDRPELSDMVRELAPEGAARLLTGSWLPAVVSSSIAVHAAEVMELDAPIRPAGTVISSSAVDGDERERSQGHAPQTPAPPAGQESVASSDTPATVPQTPAVDADVDTVATGGVSRRKMFTAGASVAGVALFGGGGAWALTRGDEPTSPSHPAAKSKKKHGASAAAPSQTPETTRPPGVAPQADWRVTVHDLLTAPPLVVGNVVVVESSAGWTGIDASTGKKIWSREDHVHPGAMYHPRVFAKGKVVAHYRNTILGIDVKTGKQTWQYDCDEHLSIFSPVTADERYIYGTGCPKNNYKKENSLIFCFDTKKKEIKWTHETDSLRYADDDTGIVLAGDYIVITFDKCNIAVHEAQTGKKVWKRGIGTEHSAPPWVEGKTLYQPGKKLRAVDIETGRMEWSKFSHKDEIDPDVSSPVLSGGVLYAARGHSIYALDPKTGKQEWAARAFDGHDYRSPNDNKVKVSHNRIYSFGGMTKEGIKVYHARNGELLWSFKDSSLKTGDWRVSIARGFIYATCEDYVYRLSAT